MKFLPEFPDLPFSMDLLPTSAYLVGGAVRDALLHRKRNYLDLDFVLPSQAVDTAKIIADRYRAGFVLLDEVRQIARVVFPQATVDFALQEGESLERDLRRRDFTINAIAYNLHRQKLVDPLHGLSALERKTIETIAPANLEEDPLRLLRAYRQAAQLDFAIAPATKATIRSLASLIKQVAAERVRSELNYLFAHPRGSRWLKAAWEDGLLQPWFPQINKSKIDLLSKIDAATDWLKKIGKNWVLNLENEVKLAKIAALVATKPTEAEAELVRLKYSRAEIKAVVTVVKYLPQLQNFTTQTSIREQYFFFLAVKETFPILGILAKATGISAEIIIGLCDRYFDTQDKVAHPQTLVTGKELMEFLLLKPSPLIGKLLTEIQIAHAEGKITTPQTALDYASEFIKNKKET